MVNSESNTNSNEQSNSQPESSARIVLPKPPEEQTVIDSISQLFADELNKPQSDISVVIDFKSGEYVKGVYGLEKEPGGGLFIAQGEKTNWKLLWYGKGEDFCSNVSKFSITEEMKQECR